MLVLTRKPQERIILTSGALRIEIVIADARGDYISVGIKAPPEVKILRGEIEDSDAKK